MAGEPKSQSGWAEARQTREKFDLYLLSLVFTLLALSIQTAKFGFSVWANSLELVGWAFFVISGLAGLSRFEWIPVMRVRMADRTWQKASASSPDAA